jgi:hypothetical protein
MQLIVSEMSQNALSLAECEMVGGSMMPKCG